MYKNICIAAILLFLTSCLRVDENLFNPDTTITAYKMDEFEGEVDFILDNNYKIPENLVHVFTLDSEGKTIHGIYIGDTAKIKTDTVIMYCHGNKWHMDFYWQRAKLLAHSGHKNRFGVLMIDYTGFGLSKGDPTEQALYENTSSAIEWLKLKGLTSERLVIYGFSLGSAPAINLTANPKALIPAKLIVEAPFASSAVMVQDAALLAMPVSYFVNVKINNAEEIKKVNQPFMWIHGTDDDFLSIKTHGELVYSNYSGKNSQAHRISGANHGDVPIVWEFENYSKAIAEFIEN
ncbi:MAG: alpha/beta hydrolase [Bacteroidetes bacterium]|nr:alpha/beta hydrolase [Bacteroidota bacterium]HET6243976.1 alpha/beta hydrolase [Bacteroidia bacterium]